MKIDEMPAGRDMDRLMHKALGRETEYRCFVDCMEGDNSCVVDSDDCLVAELLNRDKKTYPNDCEHWKAVDPPEYSTDIYAAWEAIETIKQKWNIYVGTIVNEQWVCVLSCTEENNDFISYDSFGENAPLAICRAALKAILATDEVDTDCKTKKQGGAD